jgi:UDP-N-acetylmuramoyl-L-alanyl-D-glutamate--2,6-diaminopimelate ligase
MSMSFRSLVKKLIPTGLFSYIEPYGHLIEAFMWNTLYGFPGRGMKVIGVTGTNGKTSTSFIIHRMLTEAGYKTGLMTTVAYGVNDDIRNQIHHYTNVPVPELMRRLKWMRQQNIDWLVLEVTSQGLAQNRVFGVPFSVAVLTNITHEHLDYHKTFKRYVEAKRKLFKLAAKNRRGLQAGIANADDPNGSYFATTTPNPVLYGIENGDVRATSVHLTPGGSNYTALSGSDTYKIVSHIPGSFYVSNTLAAVCVGRVLGLDRQQIEHGIAALKGVEGRMTTIDDGQAFDVIVDYAHTPDSFEKLFKDMKPVVKGKLIVVFGSAGRRDEAKRAVQGELAGKFCDEVVITEEDDRDVDGYRIMDQIAEGAKKAGKQPDKDLFLILDRTKAIKFALQRATSGDTVLLLGKGHEKTIERADGEHPWNEIEEAHKTLKAILKK